MTRPAARTVVETPLASAELPIWKHGEWSDTLPWLVHGVTGRAGAEPYDMSPFGASPASVIQNRWATLQRFTGMGFAVLARQVHGSVVLRHTCVAEGLLVTGRADGHLTVEPDVLLTVSIADCVPISIVDVRRRAVALLHGGWRGIAAGILERGVAMLREHAGSRAADLHVHLGPAICGECYEVGPEVQEALGAPPAGARTLDLRAVLAARAATLDVPAAQITVSGHCTRCGAGFHSHRAGARERQVAVLGIRPDASD